MNNRIGFWEYFKGWLVSVVVFVVLMATFGFTLGLVVGFIVGFTGQAEALTPTIHAMVQVAAYILMVPVGFLSFWLGTRGLVAKASALNSQTQL